VSQADQREAGKQEFSLPRPDIVNLSTNKPQPAPMSVSFDNPEYPAAPAPLPTDTLVDSVVILLTLTAVQRLVGFVRAVLFCRWLDAEQLGQWDMVFSFLLLAAPLSVLAIPGTFGRYLEHYRQRGQLRTFLRRASLVCGGLALMASLAIVLARDWFSDLIFGSEDQAAMVVLAAGCLTTTILYNFLVELFTALRNIRLVSVMQLVNGVAFAILGVGLLLTWQCTAKSVLLAYGGSCLIAAMLAGAVILRSLRGSRVGQSQRGPTEGAKEHGGTALRLSHTTLSSRCNVWPKIAPFAAWVLLANVLTNLFEVIDRYMIVHFSGAPASAALDVVGNYHSSRVVPMLLVSIAAMLSTMITPHLSHDWEAGRRQQVVARLRLFLKLFGFGLYAGGVAVLICAPLLFGFVLHGKFPEGEAVLPWTLVYCTWFGMVMVVQNYLLCAEKAGLSSVALGCGLALNVPLNLVLLPRMGLEGAVLSTAAAHALSLGLICLFNRRLGFHLDDGAKLVLVLPMLLCLGPWVAVFALVAVVVDAIWCDRLLSPDEKRQLAEGVAGCGRRFGLERMLARLRPARP
jgi:polysaccharide transporter, PST family